MINLSKETIFRYKDFIEWTETLSALQEDIWLKPVAEGKASVREIISHLTNWDNYLIYSIIPAVRNGEEMVFPDFDSFNEKAYEYARSGISRNRLLDEFKQTRIQLVEMLLADLDLAVKHVPANGVAICPHTNTPYSLLYIIHEFIEHDIHHKNQILSVT